MFFLLFKIDFDPSVIIPEANSSPSDVNGPHAEQLLCKKAKSGLKAACIPITVDFERVFTALEIHQVFFQYHFQHKLKIHDIPLVYFRL